MKPPASITQPLAARNPTACIAALVLLLFYGVVAGLFSHPDIWGRNV